MINIITDSTSDLTQGIIDSYHIKVIPLTVTIGGRTFKDGVDIQQEGLFGLVEKYSMLPKTSAPSVGEFEAAFDRPGEIIFIGISSKLSATIQNARLAACAFPEGKVRVVDSFNLSTGVGLLAINAAELRDRSFSASQIESELMTSTRKVRTSFLIDTMEYLYKGGRCSAIQAFAGSVLKIHPIIEVKEDGILGVREKARGSYRAGLQRLVDDFESKKDQVNKKRVFITTTSSNLEDIAYLEREVKMIASPEELFITRAGSVIASHCGPGTSGILYFIK